jgi:hypothetical protein
MSKCGLLTYGGSIAGLGCTEVSYAAIFGMFCMLLLQRHCRKYCKGSRVESPIFARQLLMHERVPLAPVGPRSSFGPDEDQSLELSDN